MNMKGYWWQVLNVTETSDYKTIKRAYAKLIKQYRPESHPTEFSLIRQSYEEGCLIAKDKKSPFVTVENVLEPRQEQQSEIYIKQPDFEAKSDIEFIELDSQLSNEDQKNSILEQIESSSQMSEYNSSVLSHTQIKNLIQDYIKCLEKWKEVNFKNNETFKSLIYHEGLNNIESYREIKYLLIDFLQNQIHLIRTPISEKTNIPISCLIKLNELFKWSDDGFEFEAYFNEEKYQYILAIMNKSHKPVHRLWEGIKSVFRLLSFLSKLISLFFVAAFIVFLGSLPIFMIIIKLETGMPDLVDYFSLLLMIGIPFSFIYHIYKKYFKPNFTSFKYNFLNFNVEI